MFFIQSDSKKTIRMIDKALKNMNTALRAFGAAVSEELKQELLLHGKGIKEIDYQKLELVNFGKFGSYQTTGLIYPDLSRTTSISDSKQLVIMVSPREKSDILDYMASQNPWPVGLLPNFFKNLNAKSISRSVTIDEYVFRIREMLENGKNEEKFVEWGYMENGESFDKQLEKLIELAAPEGVTVQEDLGWVILRKEYGVNDESVPHWRRSLETVGVRVSEDSLSWFLEVAFGKKEQDLRREKRNKVESINRFQDLIKHGGWVANRR